jgi:hypothetical protein
MWLAAEPGANVIIPLPGFTTFSALPESLLSWKANEIGGAAAACDRSRRPIEGIFNRRRAHGVDDRA